MHLALRMGRTLGELCETMTSAEWGLWLEMYQTDPWDMSREDWNAGLVAATIANYAGRMRDSDSGPAKPGDFMMFPIKPKEQQPETDPFEHFKKFL